MLENIKKIICERHGNDEKQLEVIFSTYPRILVVAPAGYGKTRTMISKIAYMIATNQVAYPKRILALTFSVNAAYKIKKDVEKELPEILEGTKIDFDNKLFISNYHGFCRSILKKYGYLICKDLKKLDDLVTIDDDDPQQTCEAIKGLNVDIAMNISKFSEAVKKINTEYIKENFNLYNNLVIKEFLTRKFISFNAVLTLTIKLLKDYPSILSFYQNYFAAILVDEYQDTNILSFQLLKLMVNNNSKIVLFGDRLQRIYGFIGAIPHLLDKSKKLFDLEEIRLTKNYRFKNNEKMLLLDANLRKNAENPEKPVITKCVKIDFKYLRTQEYEAKYVLSKVKEIVQKDRDAKIAILVRNRGSNVNKIIDVFISGNIPFFYGLFTDDDKLYRDFNKKCLEYFNFYVEKLGENIPLKQLLKNVKEKVEKEYSGYKNNYLIKALLKLLEVFSNKIILEYNNLRYNDKVKLIRETFEYRGIRQYMEFVDANVIISTVHASKGLEWDYVILPDMEKSIFPSWKGLCNKCIFNEFEHCEIKWDEINKSKMSKNFRRDFYEELSIFYVAVTRAKKGVFFSASKFRIDRNHNIRKGEISCFLRLPGIVIG